MTLLVSAAVGYVVGLIVTPLMIERWEDDRWPFSFRRKTR